MAPQWFKQPIFKIFSFFDLCEDALISAISGTAPPACPRPRAAPAPLRDRMSRLPPLSRLAERSHGVRGAELSPSPVAEERGRDRRAAPPAEGWGVGGRGKEGRGLPGAERAAVERGQEPPPLLLRPPGECESPDSPVGSGEAGAGAPRSAGGRAGGGGSAASAPHPGSPAGGGGRAGAAPAPCAATPARAGLCLRLPPRSPCPPPCPRGG